MSSKELGTKTTTVYKVETTWPDTARPENADKFGTYYAHAYTLSDDPGAHHSKLAVIREPELFKNRVTGESLHFSTAEPALAVAELLETRGRMAAGWEGNEKWHENYRGSLKARVILEIVTTHRELVTK